MRARCPAHDVVREPGSVWIRALAVGTAMRAQGWKLHVSAGPDPVTVLHRCLDVLAADRVHFKVLASHALLVDLSAGTLGLSQIGKFITVYPASDPVALARALDAATAGLAGPAIPSDRAFRAGSLVHYRYGSFTGQGIVTPSGTREPCVRDRRGRVHAAGARPRYEQPVWVRNPFPVAAPDPSHRTDLVAGRFAPLHLLAHGARGRTMLALDVEALRRCVVKEARAWTMLGSDGTDARQRLAHEAGVLARIEPAGLAPRPYALVTQADASYLAIEDVAGQTVESSAMRRIAAHGAPSARSVAALAVGLGALVARLHRRGWVHRDLKPANVVGSRGRYRLLDFELALPIGARAAWGLGTDGYMSPQQRARGPATTSDDVYALGGILLFAATGASPPAHPAPDGVAADYVRRLNPRLPPALVAMIGRCLSPSPDARPRSAAVAAMAARWLQSRRVAPAARPRWSHQTSSREAPLPAFGPAARSEAAVVTAAVRARLHASDAPIFLNDGLAGGVLALSAIVARAPTPARRRLLADASAALMRHGEAAPSRRLPGLFVGDAGVAAAVLGAANVLDDASMRRWAMRRALWALRQPTASPDVFHGSAGRLWLGLRLLEGSRSTTLRLGVRRLAHELCDRSDDGLWRIPPGYDGLSGHAYYGFAHGAAGIGSVLLLAHRMTGDVRCRDVAADVGRRLRSVAVATLSGRGLTWPISDVDASLPGPYWCHGAAGVGAFFLDLWRAGVDPAALEIATAAGRTVVETGRWLGTTRCHGLSGSVDYVLDLYQATGDARWRDAATRLGALLMTAVGRQARRRQTDIGLMTGAAGSLAALLRLSDEASSGLLSARLFRQEEQEEQDRSNSALDLLLFLLSNRMATVDHWKTSSANSISTP